LGFDPKMALDATDWAYNKASHNYTSLLSSGAAVEAVERQVVVDWLWSVAVYDIALQVQYRRSRDHASQGT
jgi:hypothetical protein